MLLKNIDPQEQLEWCAKIFSRNQTLLNTKIVEELKALPKKFHTRCRAKFGYFRIVTSPSVRLISNVLKSEVEN